MSNIITDEHVSQMHPRQSEILMQVPVEDRSAVLDRAYFTQNISGGNLSGNLWSALQEYKRVGAVELRKHTKDANARLMGWDAR